MKIEWWDEAWDCRKRYWKKEFGPMLPLLVIPYKIQEFSWSRSFHNWTDDRAEGTVPRAASLKTWSAMLMLSLCLSCLHCYVVLMPHPPRSPRCCTRTHLLPMLSCLSLAHICSLGLCPFSGLVCDLLPRRFFDGSPKEEYLSHNLDQRCLEDTRFTGCLSCPSGGAPFPGSYVSW